MAVSTSAIFPVGFPTYSGQVTAANTNRDGTGTLVTLYTVGSNGGQVEYIRVKAIVTTTAGMVRLYVSTDAGVTKRLWVEIVVAAVTVAADTAGFEGEFVPTRPLWLPASAIVYASTHNAEAINVFANAKDY